MVRASKRALKKKIPKTRHLPAARGCPGSGYGSWACRGSKTVEKKISKKFSPPAVSGIPGPPREVPVSGGVTLGRPSARETLGEKKKKNDLHRGGSHAPSGARGKGASQAGTFRPVSAWKWFGQNHIKCSPKACIKIGFVGLLDRTPGTIKSYSLTFNVFLKQTYIPAHSCLVDWGPRPCYACKREAGKCIVKLGNSFFEHIFGADQRNLIKIGSFERYERWATGKSVPEMRTRACAKRERKQNFKRNCRHHYR